MTTDTTVTLEIEPSAGTVSLGAKSISGPLLSRQLSRLRGIHLVQARLTAGEDVAERESAEAGRALAEIVFPDPIWAAIAEGDGLSTIRLRFAEFDSPEARLWLGLPWEILRLPDGRSGLAGEIDVIRSFRGIVGVPPRASSRALVAAAVPADRPSLEPTGEVAAIASSSFPSKLVLCAREPDLEDTSGGFFHFIGHGEQRGLIVEDDSGSAALVDAERLLARIGRPSFIFLSCCHGATPDVPAYLMDTSATAGGTGSLAAELHGLGCPNVLAWRGRVEDGLAARACDVFYRHLAETESLSGAVRSTRMMLAAEAPAALASFVVYATNESLSLASRRQIAVLDPIEGRWTEIRRALRFREADDHPLWILGAPGTEPDRLARFLARVLDDANGIHWIHESPPERLERAVVVGSLAPEAAIALLQGSTVDPEAAYGATDGLPGLLRELASAPGQPVDELSSARALGLHHARLSATAKALHRKLVALDAALPLDVVEKLGPDGVVELRTRGMVAPSVSPFGDDWVRPLGRFLVKPDRDDHRAVAAVMSEEYRTRKYLYWTRHAALQWTAAGEADRAWDAVEPLLDEHLRQMELNGIETWLDRFDLLDLDLDTRSKVDAWWDRISAVRQGNPPDTSSRRDDELRLLELIRSGRPDAISLAESMVAKEKGTPGEAPRLEMLGQALLSLQRFDEAETVLERALELKRENFDRILSGQSPDRTDPGLAEKVRHAIRSIGVTLTSIGVLKDSRGQHDAAIQVLERSLEMKVFAHGTELNPDVGATLHALAVAHRQLGAFDTALDYIERSVLAEEAYHGYVPDAERTVIESERAFVRTSMRGEQVEPAVIVDWIARTEEGSRGEPTIVSGNYYQDLGMVQLRCGDFVAAIRSLETAIQIRDRLSGEQTGFRQGLALVGLAQAYLETGQLEKVAPCAERARAHLGPDAPMHWEAVRLEAMSLARQDRSIEALEQVRAASPDEEEFPQLRPLVAAMRLLEAQLLVSTGEPDAGAAMAERTWDTYGADLDPRQYGAVLWELALMVAPAKAESGLVTEGVDILRIGGEAIVEHGVVHPSSCEDYRVALNLVAGVGGWTAIIPLVRGPFVNLASSVNPETREIVERDALWFGRLETDGLERLRDRLVKSEGDLVEQDGDAVTLSGGPLRHWLQHALRWPAVYSSEGVRALYEKVTSDGEAPSQIWVRLPGSAFEPSITGEPAAKDESREEPQRPWMLARPHFEARRFDRALAMAVEGLERLSMERETPIFIEFVAVAAFASASMGDTEAASSYIAQGVEAVFTDSVKDGLLVASVLLLAHTVAALGRGDVAQAIARHTLERTDDPDLEARLLLVIHETRLQAGGDEEAEAVLESARSKAREEDTRRDVALQTAQSRARRGDWSGSADAYGEFFALGGGDSELRHHHLLEYGVNLANAGRREEAVAQFEAAVKAASDVFWSGSIQVAAAYAELGICLEGLKRFGRARYAYQEALKRCQEGTTIRRADPVFLRERIGVVASRVGDHGQARQHLEAAIESGDENTNFSARLELAISHRDAGRLDAAIGLLRECERLAELRYGGDAASTLKARDHLGNALFRATQYEEALGLHARNLEVRRAQLGEADNATQISRNDVATCLLGLGKDDEAFGLFREALEHAPASFPGNSAAGLVLLNLTRSLTERGRTEEAARFLQTHLPRVQQGSRRAHLERIAISLHASGPPLAR